MCVCGGGLFWGEIYIVLSKIIHIGQKLSCHFKILTLILPTLLPCWEGSGRSLHQRATDSAWWHTKIQGPVAWRRQMKTGSNVCHAKPTSTWTDRRTEGWTDSIVTDHLGLVGGGTCRVTGQPAWGQLPLGQLLPGKLPWGQLPTRVTTPRTVTSVGQLPPRVIPPIARTTTPRTITPFENHLA